ncbi:carbohydrate ABC transporter permease [Mariniplasma anaerobium]|uniref:ABC transporter permease n=1 Tax=Mariniplasma anaerobium TaxID=2735436 RepID=A0A7U9XVY1_9MOLU|nr:sugar ABC transporter permease [Mariniplasma anaerobium]BCR35796.1 ABC transporter permease [Mariniplasma anaerobium]
MKNILKSIAQFLNKFFEKIGNFYTHKVSKGIDKAKFILEHNFLIRREGLTLTLFSFLKINVTRKRREAFYGIMFIMLWIIGFLIFTLYPMFYSLYLSFNEAYYSLETGVETTFIGFTNYLNVFRSQSLLPLFGTYIGKMIIAVPLIVVFSILIAVLINNPIKLKGIWRTIFFLPVIISTGPVINELNNQNATSIPALEDSSVIVYISENLGPWLANPIEAILTSMLLILWYAGIPILIFLAGLQKIDGSIYEAASIDGASPWDRFWKITLPSIKPLISVSVIYIVVSMSLFVEPEGILDLARLHMLIGAPDSNFWFGYGYAAAIAWVYFLLMVIIMGVFILILSARRKENR